MTWLRGLLTLVSLLAGVLIAAFFLLGPQWVDRNANQVFGDPGRHPRPRRAHSAQADRRGFARGLRFWGKDLLRHNNWGQVDLPRLIEGGATLQMFTTVTKSPQGQNYEQNATDTADNITLLAMAQRWPAATFDSLFARAMLPADRVREAAAQSPQLTLITSQVDSINYWPARSRRGGSGGAVGYRRIPCARWPARQHRSAV